MEQILNAGDRRFIVKDTIMTHSPEEHQKISELLQSEKVIFLQRPNDNHFYLVDEILPATVIEEIEYAKTPIPFEDLPAFEFSEPTLPKEEPKKKEESQPEETKESEVKSE